MNKPVSVATNTVVYVVSDDVEVERLAEEFWRRFNIPVHLFSNQQWSSRGIEQQTFLPTGNFPIKKEEVIFPSSMMMAHPKSESIRKSKAKTLEEHEYELIKQTISDHKGNMSRVAKVLGIGRATLYRKMKVYGLYKDLSRRMQSEMETEREMEVHLSKGKTNRSAA